MTLAEMTLQFVSLMNRTDLRNNTALASTFITQAILRIERELRVPMQEVTLLETIDDTYDPAVGLTIPEDYLELIGIYAGADQEYQLQRSQFSKVKAAAVGSTGYPREFTRLGNHWIIGPSPAVDDVLMIQYYAKFPALVAPTDTNELSEVAWDAVVYAALAAACDYYNDDRLPNFEKRYVQIVTNLQAAADGDALTADAALDPVYAWPDDGI